MTGPIPSQAGTAGVSPAMIATREPVTRLGLVYRRYNTPAVERLGRGPRAAPPGTPRRLAVTAKTSAIQRARSLLSDETHHFF